MATLVAFLPAEDAQTIKLAIEKCERVMKLNTPTFLSPEMQAELDKEVSDFEGPSSIGSSLAAARKADALTAIAKKYLEESKDDGKAHRRPVTVSLTIDLPTLLGLANHPGELQGYGAIPANVARQLAVDGKWRRFITDPTNGNLLDCGRESYIPSQQLVDFIMARDKTCRFPGCRQPAHLSDLDHAVPWDEGGTTSANNLGSLCRRHHNLKTHHGWKLINQPDGACTWISPAGHKYFVPARPVLDSV